MGLAGAGGSPSRAGRSPAGAGGSPPGEGRRPAGSGGSPGTLGRVEVPLGQVLERMEVPMGKAEETPRVIPQLTPKSTQSQNLIYI